MKAIPVVNKDEQLEIRSRNGDNKALGLGGISNRALKLAIKSDMLAELFEACMSKEKFPTA